MSKKKVALLFVCVNTHYWTFLKDVIADCKKNFLPEHDVDYFVWSDIPEIGSKETGELLDSFPTEKELADTAETVFGMEAMAKSWAATIAGQVGQQRGAGQAWINALQKKAQELTEEWVNKISAHQKNGVPIASAHSSREEMKAIIEETRKLCKDIIYTEPVQWPLPTLMRYHLFLQQEEKFKDYDYIFYMDADMRVVDVVGNEILGQGLTMAEHPMYSLRREYIPPYEPNTNSTAYIPRFGSVIDEGGKPRFKPLYAAGGFQGGTKDEFIKAMKEMRRNIDKDFMNNYTAIWNDESHWNKYLSTYQGHIVALTPAYIYPDSLINEYYTKVWGCNYAPKIVTLTKKFSTSKEAGADLQKKLASM